MDFTKYWLNHIILFSRNQRFKKTHKDFPLPPHHLAFDAYNTFEWDEYYNGGRLHAGVFADIVTANCKHKDIAILEWGCGPGRIIRHLASLLPDHNVSISGADYNPETITWCSENLKGMKFVLNKLMPPLDFADNQFDVTYNFSVLTHLSTEAQRTWIAELWRVLKPGGLLICTTHGDAYTHLLTSKDELQKYSAGEAVVQGRYVEGKKWYLSIHPEKFVKETLLKDFTDLKRIPVGSENNMLQDVWLARKPFNDAGENAEMASSKANLT